VFALVVLSLLLRSSFRAGLAYGHGRLWAGEMFYEVIIEGPFSVLDWLVLR
jgi:hypothetical protein